MENKLKLGVTIIGLLFVTSCAQSNLTCQDKCQTKKEMKPIIEESKEDSTVYENSSNQPVELVCKFVGEELAEKKELLKKEIFSQVQKTEEANDGYVLYFEDKNDILLKLSDYLMIEKECCPFFTFNLNILSNSKGIALKIAGSDDAKSMLKPLVDEIQEMKD